MSRLLQDLRLSLRQLRRYPGFTLAALLCLGLGIGANSATFSFAWSMLFDRFDLEQPERLARIFVTQTEGGRYGPFSYLDYTDLRQRSGDVFVDIAAEAPTPLHLAGSDGSTSRVWGSIVSGNYFDLLGVPMAAGRGFLPEEDRTRDSHPVAVISHQLWQRQFGGDPQIIGQTVSLNNHTFSIVGRTPEGFSGANAGLVVDLWVPLMMQAAVIPQRQWLDDRNTHWLRFVIARLRPGVSLAQAQARCDAVMRDLVATYPDSHLGKGLAVYSEAKAGLHPSVRGAFVGFLTLMFGVVGFVLLLACANVAGLYLARSAARSKEIAIRLALGASRGKLIRQLLTESTVLALLAGVVGLAIAAVLIRLVLAYQPDLDSPLTVAVQLDWRIVAFSFAAALLTSLLFGLAPALQSSRPDLVSSLKDGAALLGGKTSRLRKVLVIGQICLSLILLIGAGMVLRSLGNARHIDVGFTPEKAVVAAVNLNLQGYDEEAGKNFFRLLKSRVAALPGVQKVGLGQLVPLTPGVQQRVLTLPAGYQIAAGSLGPSLDYNRVGVDYFEAMEIEVLAGRAFEQSDAESGRMVMVVNRTFADRYWPERDPIGRQVSVLDRQHDVVGVVEDGKYGSLGESPQPYFYLLSDQHYNGSMHLHVRTTGDPVQLLEAVRREVRALDQTLPVYNLRTLEDHLGYILLPSKLAANLVSAFALLALFLASVGLYAVIAYWVSQGARDIAIRMAVGARSADVLALVLKQGLYLAAIGIAVGLLVGFLLSKGAASLLYGVSATQPLTYLVAGLLLILVALAATFIPARRATRVDPNRVLRAQ